MTVLGRSSNFELLRGASIGSPRAQFASLLRLLATPQAALLAIFAVWIGIVSLYTTMAVGQDTSNYHQRAATGATQHPQTMSTSTFNPTPAAKPTATPAAATTKGTKSTIDAGPAGTSPVAASGKEFGISPGGGLTYLGDSDLAVRLDRIKGLGVSWLRFDVDWSVVQAGGSGSYDWSGVDRVVDGARTRGLKVLGIITYTPGWARRSDCASSDKCAPANPSDYAHFVSAVAGRYGPRGVHTWEIWNEPNFHAFWEPAPNVNDYAAILAAGYQAAKQADPGATILSGGLAAMTVTSGSDISGPDFLAGLYAAGQKPHFDAVSYHPYSYPALPSTYGAQNAWSELEQTPQSLRSAMIAAGDSDKKIWGTEFGAPTNGPGSSASSTSYNESFATDHVTEALQAQIAASAISLWKTYSWAGPLFWLSDTDDGTSTSDRENFFGLIRADGSHKPAYDTFRQAVTN